MGVPLAEGARNVPGANAARKTAQCTDDPAPVAPGRRDASLRPVLQGESGRVDLCMRARQVWRDGSVSVSTQESTSRSSSSLFLP